MRNKDNITVYCVIGLLQENDTGNDAEILFDSEYVYTSKEKLNIN